ncbi:MAG: 50S ribosomal protein L11 methyltransferase [Gammaproteobacteria bacterium]
MRSERADQHIAKIAAQKTPYFKTINKIKLRIDDGVYPTGKIGKLFNKALSLSIININNKKVVLDYGTGTGFLAIAAAKNGAKVVGIDKNPIAIQSAIYNAEKNNVSDQIDFRISDNLSAIYGQEKFDIVLAGLPWRMQFLALH